MPRKSAAAINPRLTNYSQGISQDMASALADFICPVVRVAATVGHFKKYDAKNRFQVHDTARAIGGPTKRIQFAATDPTYDCRPNGLSITIDDAERDAAGEDQAALEENKTSTLITSARLSHEDQVFTLVKTTMTAVQDKGIWSDTSVDPIAELDEQIGAILDASGQMPNRMVLGFGAWRVAKNHPKVLGRANVGKDKGVGLDQFASMLANPSMEVRVGVLSKDATKWGKDKSAQNLVGLEVFIFYASPTPTLYDASFAKSFQGGTGGIDSVKMYRDEDCDSDVIKVNWSVDNQVVFSECGKRLAIT